MQDFEALVIQVYYHKHYFADLLRIDVNKNDSPKSLHEVLNEIQSIPVDPVTKYVVVNDTKHHVQEISMQISLRTTEHTYVQMIVNFGDSRSWRFLIRHFYLQLMGYSVLAKGVN